MSTDNDNRPPDEPLSVRLGLGSWIVLIVLLALLVATGVVIYFGWILGNGTDVPVSGYVAMAFGVIISLAVGFGLMALIFYSSRKGYDEPPVLIIPAEESNADPDSTGKNAAAVESNENGLPLSDGRAGDG
jgi:hypothetical protein